MLIKTVKDYYEELYKKFPDVPKQDIRKIVKEGWKLVYRTNSYGGDVIIRDNSFWCYFGMLKRSALEHFNYYVKKLALKIRILYRRKKIDWDGYYYFGRTEKLYQDYLSQSKKRGRKRKLFTFKDVFLYLILDECRISNHSCPYIFRIPYASYIKFMFYLPELVTKEAELIETREPMKFKDILISDNDYDVL